MQAVPGDAAPLAAPLPVEALPFGFTDGTVASVDSPTAVRAMPDGRVVVLGKAGTVHVVRGGAFVAPRPSHCRVCSQGERGLLGFEVDPTSRPTGRCTCTTRMSMGDARWVREPGESIHA